MTLDIQKFKERLEEEKKALEKERVENGPVREEADLEMHDEIADMLENLEEKEATETELEQSLTKINQALARIANGTYGLCQICQNPIETERLEVSPEATTCKAHLNQ